MNTYLLLHFGFEQPTPEIMQAWGVWFESIADICVDQGGFGSGKEISKTGAKELPWDGESITGYNIIKAENIDEAENIARQCPFITSIRVYEIRNMSE